MGSLITRLAAAKVSGTPVWVKERDGCWWFCTVKEVTDDCVELYSTGGRYGTESYMTVNMQISNIVLVSDHHFGGFKQVLEGLFHGASAEKVSSEIIS